MATKKPTYRTRLDPVPDKFKSDAETWRFLNQLRERVGGNSGDLIYDTAQDANTAAALEPLVFSVNAAVQSELEGQVRAIIEQIQEQNIDISGLLTETQDVPTPPELPEDFPVGAIVQMAIENGLVKSVFGRTGDVVALEGDYDLEQLGDVTITAPVIGDYLGFDGTNWLNIKVDATKLQGEVPIVNGGTGQDNATDAFNALAPAQTGNAGKVLTTDGTVTSWSTSLLGNAPVYVQMTDPAVASPYVWFQTDGTGAVIDILVG